MHELSIIEALYGQLTQLQKEQGNRRIVQILLRIGSLEHINMETFQFIFEQTKQGTCAENASLHLIVEPLKLQCRSCHSEFEPNDGIWLCPRCNSVGGEIIQGTDIILDAVIFE